MFRRLVDGRAKYYELGGLNRRNWYWMLWCKHVRHLIEQKSFGSSLSETTAGSSTSISGFSSVSRKSRNSCKCKLKNDEVLNIFACYEGAGDAKGVKTWPEKNMYFGPQYEELGNGNYAPIPISFTKESLQTIK